MLRRQQLGRLLEMHFVDVVARHGGEAAVEKKRFAVMPRHPQEMQHHVLMVSLEENGRGIALLIVNQNLDYVPGRRTAVNVVTDENHGVVLAGINRPQQTVQFLWTTVNVTNGENARVLSPSHYLAV